MTPSLRAIRPALILILLCLPVEGAERSASVRAEFERLVPCPVEGPGTCAAKGFEADHIIALICGGPDTIENLQWLTKEQHRKKTREDLKACRFKRQKNNR